MISASAASEARSAVRFVELGGGASSDSAVQEVAPWIRKRTVRELLTCGPEVPARRSGIVVLRLSINKPDQCEAEGSACASVSRASNPNKSPVSPALLDKSCEFVKSYGITKPYLEMPLMSLSARQVVSVAVTAIWMRPLAFSFVTRPPESATAIVV